MKQVSTFLAKHREILIIGGAMVLIAAGVVYTWHRFANGDFGQY